MATLLPIVHMVLCMSVPQHSTSLIIFQLYFIVVKTTYNVQCAFDAVRRHVIDTAMSMYIEIC